AVQRGHRGAYRPSLPRQAPCPPPAVPGESQDPCPRLRGDAMSPEQAFLQAVVANPDDDGPRLVYADWLEEQGRGERAEVIRGQIELARLPEGHPGREPLSRREQELLELHWKEWQAELPGHAGVSWLGDERGFTSVADVEWPVFLEHREELFAATPLR